MFQMHCDSSRRPCSRHAIIPFPYTTEPWRWEAEGSAHGHWHHHGAQASGPGAPYQDCSQHRALRDKGRGEAARGRGARGRPLSTPSPHRGDQHTSTLWGPRSRTGRPDKYPPVGRGQQNLHAPERQTRRRHAGSAKVGAEKASRKPVIISAAPPVAPGPPQGREHSAPGGNSEAARLSTCHRSGPTVKITFRLLLQSNRCLL